MPQWASSAVTYSIVRHKTGSRDPGGSGPGQGGGAASPPAEASNAPPPDLKLPSGPSYPFPEEILELAKRRVLLSASKRPVFTHNLAAGAEGTADASDLGLHTADGIRAFLRDMAVNGAPVGPWVEHVIAAETTLPWSYEVGIRISGRGSALQGSPSRATSRLTRRRRSHRSMPFVARSVRPPDGQPGRGSRAARLPAVRRARARSGVPARPQDSDLRAEVALQVQETVHDAAVVGLPRGESSATLTLPGAPCLLLFWHCTTMAFSCPVGTPADPVRVKCNSAAAPDLLCKMACAAFSAAHLRLPRAHPAPPAVPSPLPATGAVPTGGGQGFDQASHGRVRKSPGRALWERQGQACGGEGVAGAGTARGGKRGGGARGSDCDVRGAKRP